MVSTREKILWGANTPTVLEFISRQALTSAGNDLLRSELEQLGTVFKNLNVRPSVDEDGNCYVNRQPSLVGAILRGVICQSLRYSNPGEDFHINLSQSLNGSVQIKVEAIGNPVSQQQVDRLFAQNNLLPLPSERKFLGIGLEPSIIRELIQSEGGEFSAEPLEVGGFVLERFFQRDRLT